MQCIVAIPGKVLLFAHLTVSLHQSFITWSQTQKRFVETFYIKINVNSKIKCEKIYYVALEEYEFEHQEQSFTEHFFGNSSQSVYPSDVSKLKMEKKHFSHQVPGTKCDTNF